MAETDLDQRIGELDTALAAHTDEPGRRGGDPVGSHGRNDPTDAAGTPACRPLWQPAPSGPLAGLNPVTRDGIDIRRDHGARTPEVWRYEDGGPTVVQVTMGGGHRSAHGVHDY